MKTLRIVGAAFLVLLGAMLLVAWSVAGRAVASIESGEAAQNLTQKVLDDPRFADAAAERVTEGLVERTEGRFVQRIVLALEPEIQELVKRVITSDRLEQAATTGVGKVEDQLVAELTDPDRPSAPFTITVDLSDRVNQRIDEIPIVGPFIPAVTVPPVERELIDAQTFDQIRSIYGAVKVLSTWGLIVGVLLIVAGFFAAPRSRWYWAQAALLVFFIIFAVSLAVRVVSPRLLAGALPGGEDGGGGSFITDFLTENSIGPIAGRLLGLACVALLLAVVFAVIARFLPTRPDAVAEESADLTHEPVAVAAEASTPTPSAARKPTTRRAAVVVDTVPLDTAVVARVPDTPPPTEVAQSETLVEPKPKPAAKPKLAAKPKPAAASGRPPAKKPKPAPKKAPPKE